MFTRISLFSVLFYIASGAIEFECPDGTQVFYVHPKSCEKFIECNNGVAEEIDCFAGMHFNPAVGFCDFPENVNCVLEESEEETEAPVEESSEENQESEEVPEGGSGPSGVCPALNGEFVTFLTDLGDCTLFYMCNWGTAIQMNCPSGLHFNPVLNVCDYPQDAGCTV